MKKIFLLALLTLPFIGFAQQRKNQTVDLNLSFANGFSVASSYFYNWQLGKKRKIQIGLGARATSYFAKDKYFITAPAKITSGKTGPGVLFKENIEENLDSLKIKNVNTNSVNLALALGYHFSDKLYAGVNIDLIGFTFGKKATDATYINDTKETKNIAAKPTSFNALLISDNDLGSLNSGLFAQYKITERLGINGGVSFNFSEYTTDSEIQQYPEPNDRFRFKSLAPMIGVSWFLQ